VWNSTTDMASKSLMIPMRYPVSLGGWCQKNQSRWLPADVFDGTDDVVERRGSACRFYQLRRSGGVRIAGIPYRDKIPH
jgi:hypothetical protein